MTPRRRQTSLPINPPPNYTLRFYKIVALSFLVLTVILFGVIVFMSSKRATITITTRPTPIDFDQTIVLGESDIIDANVEAVTVSGTFAYSPTGDKEEPATARGSVTLYNDRSTAQDLVENTRLLSPEGVLFRLEERVRIPANGTAIAAVYSDTEGKQNNIGPTSFTIPGLSEPLQALVYAKSTAPMTGGTKTIGVVSQTDVDRAIKQTREALEQQAEQYFSASSTGDMKTLISIVDTSEQTDVEIDTEVDQFEIQATATVVAATFSADDLDAYVADALQSRAIDDTELVSPVGGEPTITLGSYRAEDGTVTATVYYQGEAKLNPNSKQLQKNVFYGKSKDDVRRYLLSLDHVHGVEVKFTPAWIRSVPHVGDHLSIIVKEVE
jgi:hypothetical protein